MCIGITSHYLCCGREVSMLLRRCDPQINTSEHLFRRRTQRQCENCQAQELRRQAAQTEAEVEKRRIAHMASKVWPAYLRGDKLDEEGRLMVEAVNKSIKQSLELQNHKMYLAGERLHPFCDSAGLAGFRMGVMYGDRMELVEECIQRQMTIDRLDRAMTDEDRRFSMSVVCPDAELNPEFGLSFESFVDLYPISTRARSTSLTPARALVQDVADYQKYLQSSYRCDCNGHWGAHKKWEPWVKVVEKAFTDALEKICIEEEGNDPWLPRAKEGDPVPEPIYEWAAIDISRWKRNEKIAVVTWHGIVEDYDAYLVKVADERSLAKYRWLIDNATVRLRGWLQTLLQHRERWRR